MKIIMLPLLCLSISLLVNGQESFVEKYALPAYDCDMRGIRHMAQGLIIVVPDDSIGLSSYASVLKERGVSRNMSVEVKTESQLVEKDYKSAIWIQGISGRFSDFAKLSIPVGKSGNGFQIGNHVFTDDLHSLSYISDSLQIPLRIATIGNSLESFLQITNMPGFGFEYIVLNNTVPEYIGNSGQLTDLTAIKREHYTAQQSKYYTFMLSKELDKEQLAAMEDKLKHYDQHAEAFVKKMELEMPSAKILTYVHNDQLEIKYLSGFFGALCGGTVHGFVTGDEIHSWRLGGAVEHEANHHLFNQINERPATFLSEGIQKWYEYTNDVNLKQQGLRKAKEFVDEDLTDVIKGESDFFAGDKYYLISGIFVDYLLEKYGLDKFKELYKYETRDLPAGFETTYGKSLFQVLEDYKQWLV